MPDLGPVSRAAVVTAALCISPATAFSQDVDSQLRDLQRAVQDLRAELAAVRRESDALRQEVQALRGGGGADTAAEEQQLISAKVDDLEQTKVESGSKYHVRLSGLALLQAALTQGEVDSADLPSVARPGVQGYSGGSLTAGARQSYIRLDVFGPRLAGARTAGEVTFDFFGGFPTTTEGFTSGFARLRTTSVSFDWERTRIMAGHETPFFSPRSPASLLSSAYPAFWTSGNMWSWIPQVHVSHRVATGAAANLVLQGGVLDPLTGELPVSEYDRVPTAGERTRRPATAARIAWEHGDTPRRTSLGAGAYYSPQAWGFDRDVDGWAATADWDVPLWPALAFSGEVYRGRSIAGLGASAAPSVVFAGPRESASSTVLPFRSAGGWAQLKVSPSSILEFNVAAGTDHSAPASVASLLSNGFIDPGAVRRNTTALVNGIFTARSNILFSLEYRRLRTTTLGGTTFTAGHVSVGGGVGF
jgi:hypothetical protein